MPNGTTRSAYTEAEDAHLVEFMARFGSDKGRKGKKLYQDMVENLTGQSAWAATHSWQSWRDRYVKNSDYFDKRIRIFQKKNGLWKPGGIEGAEKEVKQDEGKKRKRVSNASQEDAATVKKPKVMKKADNKGKGKEVSIDEDPELHLFVAFSKIPRRRENVDVDQGKGGGRHPVPSTSTAGASLKRSPRQVSHVKSVDGRPASNKRISAQEVKASTSRATRQQIKSTTTIESSQAVGKEGKDSNQRILEATPIPIPKSSSPAHPAENKDASLEVEARLGSESPLFTQHVKHVPDSPLFTQRARDDDLGEDVLGRGSDEEDDSMVNHLLAVPPEAKVDDERVVPKKPDDRESDEEEELHPLLQSSEPASSNSKPSHNKIPRDNRSTSTTQAEDDPQPKVKSKQPIKYLEGPYRIQLVGPNPPKAGPDPNSDAAEDLIPQVGGKTRIKKPPPTQAKHSTSKPVRKRVIVDGSSHSSSTSSPASTPTPPRERPKSLRLANSRKVVLSSDGEVDMKLSGHGENADIQVEAPTYERHARVVQKSEAETDEEEEEEESATEVEHADEVHPFDTVSQPPRTPRFTRHPFDMPQSQMLSHSSIRSHVSERDMERVIETLEKFIWKLDTDRRERLLERPFRLSEKAETTGRAEAGDEENTGEQEEEEEEGAEKIDDDAMVLDEDDQRLQQKLFATVPKGKEREHAANLRERGSPLPVRNHRIVKKPILQPESAEPEVVRQSSADLPPSSPPPIQIGEGSDRDEPMSVEEVQDGTARSVSPDKRAPESFASPPNQIEQAEPIAVEGETQMTHDSLFSSSETSETQPQFPQAADKGKARATALPVPSDEEDARHRRHTIAMVNGENKLQELDLRRLIRARRRSLPSRSSISAVSHGHSVGEWAPSSSTRRTFDLGKPLRMRLSEVDQTKLIEMNVERMVLQYGFPESFVYGIWNDCGSLDEAECILSELGSKLEDLLDRSRRRRSSVGLDVNLPLSRTVTPQDTTRESDLEIKEMPSIAQIRGLSTSPIRPTQSKRNSPQFKPTLIDADEIPESDYSPPVASRAGKFRRLSRQGRVQEALERESRRASGGILKGNKS
ncbi:hypothetical protein E1B28_002288 [Marasmius oreades]|uniref:TERF2-interacting telomeric protein 1 Myb domain-containing protein n=1 Tax=Marasmius oreades TaxID=181124 RepID=A0A9P7RMQ7_9AGAR|nr:uncharacterized protein E1B28_002288 [Marasmius oreades]KAG7086325.1 hypothetical protein E1B28_002288 [Marasmius oreades]